MIQDTGKRRRGKALEEAIFQAVWEELKEVGYSRLTMEGVARRAGTSKPVLYRRWPSRAEMMVATVRSRLPDAESLPDTGSLRGDTIALLMFMRERMASVGVTTMLGILTESGQDVAPGGTVIGQFVNQLRSVMTEVVLRRAVERGEVTWAQITERLTTVPIDLARNEFLIVGQISEDAIADIVDTVFLPALMARAR